MSQTRRLIYYILLNVFISACVTGTILFWYDRNIRADSAPSVSHQTQPEAGAANPQPTARQAQGGTPSPKQDIPIQIASVVGAGTLEAEVVSADATAKTLTIKGDPNKTVPVEGAAVAHLSHLKAGEKVKLTCRDNDKGEHQAITHIAMEKPAAKISWCTWVSESSSPACTSPRSMALRRMRSRSRPRPSSLTSTTTLPDSW